MAKLVDVYRTDKPLGRRQLPLVVDENLTMVMDLNSIMGLICDNKPVKGKQLDEFTRKVELLSSTELSDALKITQSDMVCVLNQAVPCVGCRRSVERLYYQLFKCGHPTLDPLTVNKDGVITLRADKPITASILATLFHGHSSRLNNVVDSQPRRSKKSHRCLLHSLDSQRSRPITPAWRDVWECMRPQCKEEVVSIESATLHVTLENYLRKHRFCGECRTKVLRAYTLLVEEPEPCKEKGYVSALYSDIRRCLPEKHLHLLAKTDYISKLISRAEPELMGRYDIRRERHAKTLEIAQEEVLTCLGICVYERLHRIYVRMREEESTCQVFAAVAVETLCRSFETAVEKKQGISQLELLYEEITKEEQLKQQRKEQKKLKRRRKKERLTDEKENLLLHTIPVDDEDEEEEEEEPQEDTSSSTTNSNEKLCCLCEINAVATTTSTKSKQTDIICKDCINEKSLLNGTGKSSGKKKKCNAAEISQETNAKDTSNWYDSGNNCKCSSLIETTTTTTTATNGNNGKGQQQKKNKKNHKHSTAAAVAVVVVATPTTTDDCDDIEEQDDSDLSDQLQLHSNNHHHHHHNNHHNNNNINSKQHVNNVNKQNNVNVNINVNNIKETWSSSEHSHDCGYSSENNNGCCETTSGTSSLPSSPEGSEMACSGSCCNLETDCCPPDFKYSKYSKFFPRVNNTNSTNLSLQQMLEDPCSSDEDGEGSYISAEEVLEFQSKVRHLPEKREELRQTLRKRFAQMCVNGPMQNKTTTTTATTGASALK